MMILLFIKLNYHVEKFIMAILAGQYVRVVITTERYQSQIFIFI